MEWYSPSALPLFLSLPFLGYCLFRRKRGAAVRFPSLVDLKSCPVSWRLRLRPLLVVARLLCLAMLILALARPRKGTSLSETYTEGIAIEAVVDRSGSMQAEMDYDGNKLDRLEVVKRVLTDFVEGDKKDLRGRPSDLIGLVTFAHYADTVCPLVLSHGVLTEFLRQTQIVSLRNEDGTAIGDAIALAAARLKKAEEEIQRRNADLGFAGAGEKKDTPGFTIKNKIIVLLTDGQNNRGRNSPLEAAELARKWGIKIYTIGIGSGQSFVVVNDPFFGPRKVPTRDELDEGLLKSIAEMTGGFYGRADDAESLRKIVENIDKLEKTEVKSVQYTQYDEHFGWWTLPALALLGAEMLAGCTVFRKIP